MKDPKPDSTDKKWYAIRSLGKSKDPKMPDTLYQIFKKYPDYSGTVIYALIDIDTEKSAEFIGKIIGNTQENFTRNLLNDLGKLEYTQKLFPTLLKKLKYNVSDADIIFDLLESNINSDDITKEQAIAFLPIIENFYNYLKTDKAVKDYYSLDPYNDQSPAIANCLIHLKDNKIARNILTDFLKRENTVDYKMWIVFKVFEALDAEVIPTNFFKKIGIGEDPYLFWRLEVFSYLEEENKLALLPKEYLKQEFLSECFAYQKPFSISRSKTFSPPDIKYVGTTSLSRGNYYFYLLCWGNTCMDGKLVVTGPQPFDKTKFDTDPDIQREEIASENLTEDKIKNAIKNYREK